MRRFNIHIVIFLTMLVVLISACKSSRVDTAANEAGIRQAIDSSRWVFTVNQVIPLYGRTRQPNGEYTVSYNGKQLEVYLPYFGRATSGVDVYTGRGPLDFSADQPAITKEQTKPGEWRIQLRPDIREVQIMDFTIYANGTAHLNVRLTSRSAISYRGNVQPLKGEW